MNPEHLIRLLEIRESILERIVNATTADEIQKLADAYEKLSWD